MCHLRFTFLKEQGIQERDWPTINEIAAAFRTLLDPLSYLPRQNRIKDVTLCALSTGSKGTRNEMENAGPTRWTQFR